jgi:hypothetical protein
MQDENDEEDIVFNDMCENSVYDMILNGSITESEIIDAIKIFKKNLLLIIDVKSFPRQLMRIIAL